MLIRTTSYTPTKLLKSNFLLLSILKAPFSYGNVIIGTVKSINIEEENSAKEELFKKYELNEVADVELINIEKQGFLMKGN